MDTEKTTLFVLQHGNRYEGVYKTWVFSTREKAEAREATIVPKRHEFACISEIALDEEGEGALEGGV